MNKNEFEEKYEKLVEEYRDLILEYKQLKHFKAGDRVKIKDMIDSPIMTIIDISFDKTNKKLTWLDEANCCYVDHNGKVINEYFIVNFLIKA